MQVKTLDQLSDIFTEENKCKDLDEHCPGFGCATKCWLYAPEEGWCPLILIKEQSND